MTTKSIAPLFTSEGWQLLHSLAPYNDYDALALNTHLRRQGHDPTLVAAALSQNRLRTRAEKKFGPFAHTMLFTEAGLEQASRLPAAAWHARRFHDAGITHITDLGCGLGADSLAFAAAGIRVHAVEADETTAACATVNLMAFSNATVHHADATTYPISTDPETGVWLDPSRRTTDTSGTTRIFDPENCHPPLSFATALAKDGRAVGVKVGPGIPHSAIPTGAQAQWLSIDGDLVEATLWFNTLATTGVKRSAVVLRSDRTAHAAGHRPDEEPRTPTPPRVPPHAGSVNELSSKTPYDAHHQQPPLGPIGPFIYEPDPAVIRAGLVTDLAHTLGLHLLDPHIAYLSGQQLPPSPWVKSYRVLEQLPLDVRTLRAWVRSHEVGVVEVKKRGVDVDPAQLRKRILAGMRTPGGASITIILTRLGERRHAIIAEPPHSY